MRYPRPPRLAQIVDTHAEQLKGRIVLDVACNEGYATQQIAKYADHVIAFDIRASQVDYARKNRNASNIEYVVGDALNPDFILPLVKQVDVIVNLGMFYHIFNHFGFLEYICQPNIEHIILETIYGPETPDPSMFWTFEATDTHLNGFHHDLPIIPAGTPNLAWILKAASVFGFRMDFIEKFPTDYPGLDMHANKRMALRLFNPLLLKKTKALSIDETWEWNDSNLIQQA